MVASIAGPIHTPTTRRGRTSVGAQQPVDQVAPRGGQEEGGGGGDTEREGGGKEGRGSAGTSGEGSRSKLLFLFISLSVAFCGFVYFSLV